MKAMKPAKLQRCKNNGQRITYYVTVLHVSSTCSEVLRMTRANQVPVVDKDKDKTEDTVGTEHFFSSPVPPLGRTHLLNYLYRHLSFLLLIVLIP
jgi:hypothetical protein